MNYRHICGRILVAAAWLMASSASYAVPTPPPAGEKKAPEAVKTPQAAVPTPMVAAPVPTPPPAGEKKASSETVKTPQAAVPTPIVAAPVPTPAAAPVATPTPAAAEPVKTPVAAIEPYEPRKLWGEPVYAPDPVNLTDPTKKKLLYVKENSSQPHSPTNCVMVKLTGFTTKDPAKEKGRLRVAVWDSAETYAKEGLKPFRASSHYARDAVNNEMKFQICGLDLNKKYSFFAHFDQKDTGKVNKVFGIPIDPYIFTNAKNDGKGEGLKRKGLGAPDFTDTLISVKAGEITMRF